VDIAENNGDDIRSYLGTEIPYRRKHDRDSVMTDSQALELYEVLLEHANGMWVKGCNFKTQLLCANRAQVLMGCLRDRNISQQGRWR
jgi:hypothetical protein